MLVGASNTVAITPMNKFVVYGAHRTGSHYLQTLLDSHPDINCFWDIFWSRGATPHCFNTYLASRNLRGVPRLLGRKKIIFDFLEDHYSKSADVAAAGFLLKWSGANHYPEILTWLHENDAKVIHIVRENFLVHHIAAQLRKTGIVTSHVRSEIEFSKVTLNANELLTQLRVAKKNLDAQRTKLKRYGVLEVRYEELLARESEEVARIQEFLSVNYIPNLQTEFKKTESESPSAMIENYDEVYDLLKDSEFAAYLDAKDA